MRLMDVMDEVQVLVTLDDRRRAYLGKLGSDDQRRYLVRTYPDGMMRFTPAEARPPKHDEVLLELGPRRRAHLGKVGQPAHSRYLARDFDDGTILLNPAEVYGLHEIALLRRPDILAQIEHADAHPELAVRRPLPEGHPLPADFDFAWGEDEDG